MTFHAHTSQEKPLEGAPSVVPIFSLMLQLSHRRRLVGYPSISLYSEAFTIHCLAALFSLFDSNQWV
jgi:hypothetical protein